MIANLFSNKPIIARRPRIRVPGTSLVFIDFILKVGYRDTECSSKNLIFFFTVHRCSNGTKSEKVSVLPYKPSPSITWGFKLCLFERFFNFSLSFYSYIRRPRILVPVTTLVFFEGSKRYQMWIQNYQISIEKICLNFLVT